MGLSSLWAFLRPPSMEDDDTRHRAFLLWVLLIVLCIVPIPYVLGTAVMTPSALPRALMQTAFGEIANVALLIALSRGNVRGASVAQVSLFAFFLFVTAATGRGVTGQAYVLGVPVLILIAGTLLGFRAALGITALSLVVGALLMTRLPPPRVPDRAEFVLLACAVLFPVIATLQYLASAQLRRALERAREREEEFRAIFDATPVGILVATAEGRVLLANPATLALLGYSQPGRVPERLGAVLGGGEAELAALTDGGRWVETELVRSGGGKLPVLATRAARVARASSSSSRAPKSAARRRPSAAASSSSSCIRRSSTSSASSRAASRTTSTTCSP